MKSSKTENHPKYHKISVIHFEDQKLTPFSGLLIFQGLFKGIDHAWRKIDMLDMLICLVLLIAKQMSS